MHAFFGHNNFHFRQSDQNLTRLSKGDPNKAPLVVEGQPSVRRSEVNKNFQRQLRLPRGGPPACSGCAPHPQTYGTEEERDCREGPFAISH